MFHVFSWLSVVRNLPASAGDKSLMPGREDPLKKVMDSSHSSILAGEIPWTEEPDRLQSMGLQRVRHDLVTKRTAGNQRSWFQHVVIAAK